MDSGLLNAGAFPVGLRIQYFVDYKNVIPSEYEIEAMSLGSIDAIYYDSSGCCRRWAPSTGRINCPLSKGGLGSLIQRFGTSANFLNEQNRKYPILGIL